MSVEANNHQSWDSPLESSEGVWVCQYLDLGPMDFRTVRKYISVTLSHLICGNFLQHPPNLLQMATLSFQLLTKTPGVFLFFPHTANSSNRTTYKIYQESAQFLTTSMSWINPLKSLHDPTQALYNLLRKHQTD